MAAKNFIVKNGLTVGSTEVVDSSADLTAAAFGTAANEAIDDRVNALLTAGTGVSLSYDDAAGTLTINGQVGDIQGVTAGDGLSGGGTSGTVSLAVDLNELSAATVDVANDSIPIIDAGDSSSKKESIADLVSGIAGNGLAASSGALAVDLNELTAAAVDLGNDSVAIIDASDSNNPKKESLADIATAMAGTGISASSGVFATNSLSHFDTDDLGEGSSNKYYTDERVADKIGAIMTGAGSTTVTYDDAADTITVSSTGKTTEEIQDIVGAMVSSNTETGISVTYEDGDGTLDFVVGTLNQDTTGTADNITVTANNSTDETVYPIFVDGATGSQGAESDTGLTYNPSSGILTSTQFTGNLVGNVTGNASGTAATVTTAAQPNITSLGTLTTLTVDDITINGSTISDGGDLTIDAEGDITLDANGGDIKFQDDGTDIFSLINSSSDIQLKAAVQDKDMIFRGNDGGTIFTALTLDMSEAGAATFNNKVIATELDISGNADIDGTLEADAITVDGTALNEYISDTVGAMVGSNTETGIAVTYDDSDNTLDFVVGTLNQDTTGTADNITVTANNSTDETVYPIFVDGATGSQGAESDTGLTYNPSSGLLTSTLLAGTLNTAAQTNVTSLGTLTALAVDNLSIDGNTISSTDSNGHIVLTPNGSGNVSVNSDALTVTGTESEGASLLLVADEGDDNGDTWQMVNDTNNKLALNSNISGSQVEHFSITPHATVASSTAAFPGHVTIAGNLTITGSTTTASSTNTVIADTLIELGNGTSGSPSNDSGFVIERGDSDNVFIGWDESADVVTVGTGSFTGASTGNLTHTVANFTAGVGTFSSLDISGNADIDGTLEADAFTVDGTALNEYIADTVGAMVSSNTETGITVSYEDGDNTLDFVVGTLNQDTTGTADNFTVTANNSTDETVYPVFVDGATGSQGAETDTGFTYNPNSGVITATQFTGNVTGTLTGTATGLAGTPNISVGTIASGAHTITNATNAGGTSRNIYQSTSAPSGGDGAVGDLWILYS